MSGNKGSIKPVIIFLCLFVAHNLSAQAPFSRGVNLTGWFQVSSPGQIQFTKFTKKDIANIKSLGCDVIRLPVNMHAMTSGNPDYTLDPLYLSFLDSTVAWCEELEIYLILDNHSYDPSGSTSSGIGDILIKIWSQMASHYEERSGYILYEILNEPNGITTEAWGAIQAQVISAIREEDTSHTIVIGGSGYNTYSELANLPQYSDPNLLYTFHFYDPFMFTHQGATWVTPSMEPLAGVPFPYNFAGMPSCPASLQGTWIESGLNSYPSDGNVDRIKELIDIAVVFRTSRIVNIFCGEFGVYMKNSDDADRCYWYKVVKDYLDEKNIPWTIWDYKGGFGLFENESGQMFEHDLNVRLMDSLGFEIPGQTPFTMKPDSSGFLIYTDYIGENIEDASYGAGTINFYSGTLPSNGNYSLYWYDFAQYNTISFNFVPDKDLSELVSDNYALDFMVRGSEPGIKFEIRILDSKSSEPGDHPWRMGTTIDAGDAEWDRKWHHVNIPLTAFTERGAWDIDTWYNPEGKFDWTKVDKLEISTEYADIIGKKIWFDNIHITDFDTAVVRVTEALGIEDHYGQGEVDIRIYPNPVYDHAEILVSSVSEYPVQASVFSLSGMKIRTLTGGLQYGEYQRFTWDGRNENGLEVPAGLYLLRIVTPRAVAAARIIKY